MRVRGDHGDYRLADQILNEGGQSELFECLGTGYVYKKYRRRGKDEPVTDPDVVAQLRWLCRIGRRVLIEEHKAPGIKPESSVNWPVDAVADPSGRGLAGVIIPRIPTSFCRPGGGDRRLEQLCLWRSDPPNARVRVAVLIRLAEIFNWLDTRNLVHGDLKFENVVWRGDPHPGAYLIDCDGLHEDGSLSPHPVRSPFWEDPRLSKMLISCHDRYSDRYALGLAMYRGLLIVGYGGYPVPDRIPAELDASIRQLLEASLQPDDHTRRPPPEAWVSALIATYYDTTVRAFDKTRLQALEDIAAKLKPPEPPPLQPRRTTPRPSQPQGTRPPRRPRPVAASPAPPPPPQRWRRYAPWVAAGLGALALVNWLGLFDDEAETTAQTVQTPGTPPAPAPDPQDGPEPEPASTGPLQYGEFRDGRVGREFDYEEWTFRGNAGDVVTVEIRGRSRLFVRLELFAPDGTVLFPLAEDRARAGCGADIHARELTTSGEHVVRVTSCASGADYRVRVRTQD